MADKPAPPEGYKWIYRRYIIRNGVRVYPKNAKCFRFLVESSEASR